MSPPPPALAGRSQHGGAHFSSASPLPYQKATASDVADHDNDNAASSADVKTVLDKTTALKECLQRHRSWSDPTIQAILSYLEANEAIDHMYPTYTTPELRTLEV